MLVYVLCLCDVTCHDVFHVACSIVYQIASYVMVCVMSIVMCYEMLRVMCTALALSIPSSQIKYTRPQAGMTHLSIQFPVYSVPPPD